MEKQRKTFLSYSRANKDFAIRLARELKSEGFSVWLDQLDIPAGARWDREVEKALKECEIFMIILTPASINSENVKDISSSNYSNASALKGFIRNLKVYKMAITP